MFGPYWENIGLFLFLQVYGPSRRPIFSQYGPHASSITSMYCTNIVQLPIGVCHYMVGVSGKAVSGQIKAGLYQFGSQPVLNTSHQIFHPFASAIFPMPADGAHTMDVVRRIFLDKSPETKLKQCTR